MSRLLLVVALIVYGSLYPWHFAAADDNPWLILLRSWPPQWNSFTTGDALVNIPAYAPFGVLAFLAWARRYPPPAAAAAAILSGLLLSTSMELAQVYVPGRDSSLFDVLCNVIGAFAGALAAWRFQRSASRFRYETVPPILMLGCFAYYHFSPFMPWINFGRLRFEYLLWIHPQSFSPVEVWSYTAEWVAVGVTIERLFGRVRPRWLLMALAFHFAARPIMVSRPFGLEDALGAVLAVFLWKTLPERVRSGPWLLISAVLLRECDPLHWAGAGFSWVPFQALLDSQRGGVLMLLSRAAFDYVGILWLSSERGLSYARAGVILASALTVLAILQRYLPGDALSMTDPAVVLLLTIVLQGSSNKPVPGLVALPSPSRIAI